MSEDEKAVVLALAETWNLFLKLPVEHADDTSEFRGLIHAAQDKILSRPARRELNATARRDANIATEIRR